MRNSQGDETGYGTLAVRWTEENSAVARGQRTMGRFGGLTGGERERGHHLGQGPKNCAPLECSGSFRVFQGFDLEVGGVSVE